MSALNAYGNYVLQMKGVGSPNEWTSIAGIRSVNGLNTEVAFNDSTTFDDVGGYRTFNAGLRDPGTLDLELYFDPNEETYVALESAHDANPPTLEEFRILVLTGSEQKKREFSAYVARIGESAEVDGFLQSSVSLRVSGPVNRDAS